MGFEVIEDIRAWVGEQFEIVEADGAEVGFIALLHYDGRGDEHEILLLKPGHKDWKNVNDITDVINRISDRHARGLQGVQSFQLTAGFGSGGKPSRFLPFQKNGRLEVGLVAGGGLSSEPPTEIGMRSQAMRWGEQIVHGQVASQRALNESQQKAIESRDRRIAELEGENRELFVALRNELAKTVQLAHEWRMKELEYARSSDERQKIIKLLPALVNGISGRAVFPETAADSALIAQIAEAISPQELEFIQNAISVKSPAVSALLTERFAKHQNTKREEEAQLRTLIKEIHGNDPLADAGGEIQPLQVSNGGVVKQLVEAAKKKPGDG